MAIDVTLADSGVAVERGVFVLTARVDPNDATQVQILVQTLSDVLGAIDAGDVNALLAQSIQTSPDGVTIGVGGGQTDEIGPADANRAGIFTRDNFTKLRDIADGAEVNVQADWNADSGDAFIRNKPSIPSGNRLLPTPLGSAGQVATVNAQANAVIWATPTGGGGMPTPTQSHTIWLTSVLAGATPTAADFTGANAASITSGTDVTLPTSLPAGQRVNRDILVAIPNDRNLSAVHLQTNPPQAFTFGSQTGEAITIGGESAKYYRLTPMVWADALNNRTYRIETTA